MPAGGVRPDAKKISEEKNLGITRRLRVEHELISKVLDCFEVALRPGAGHGETSFEHLRAFIDFFRGYADRCHHIKEESQLFPALERNGIPRDGGPVGCMLDEHAIGRRHIGEVVAAIDAAAGGSAGALSTIRAEGGAFIDLLRNHIAKENHVLFELADQVIFGADATSLETGFNEAEAQPDYVATFECCTEIAKRLIAQYSEPTT